MPKKIPYISIPDSPIKISTQDHLPIADITSNMVIYKNGGAAIVMESSALNFGLLSDKEQEAIIVAYAALLNSLSFAIQLTIYSKRKDVKNYLKHLETAYNKTTNPKLAGMIESYKAFVEETTKKKNVLEKNFYIIIPLSPFELGTTKSMATAAKKGKVLPFPKSYVIQKANTVLIPRRDHLIRQVGRLGLNLKQLDTNELIDLYYNLYNVDAEGRHEHDDNQPTAQQQ